MCYTNLMLIQHLRPHRGFKPIRTLRSRFDNWEIHAYQMEGGWCASASEIKDEGELAFGIGIGELKPSWSEAIKGIIENIAPMCSASIASALLDHDPRLQTAEVLDAREPFATMHSGENACDDEEPVVSVRYGFTRASFFDYINMRRIALGRLGQTTKASDLRTCTDLDARSDEIAKIEAAFR